MFKQPRVRAAVEFAAAAHAGQKRKTGEPYVSHCIETALIVEANLPHWRHDSRHETAVIAALLHDVLDDTPTTPEQIACAFGPAVSAMVVKVSKLSQVNQMLRRDKRKGVVSGDASYWQSQWQRLKRMMFEAVVEEPLVILVKLADRLHNMRTVYALAPAKQQAIAEETLAVWCSMAGSLGWHGLKSEMEDLCFAVTDTATFCSLRQQLDKTWSSPPPPRNRRRVRSSPRQQQLRALAQQQQELAAARAWAWEENVGQGLRDLRSLLGFVRLPMLLKKPAAAVSGLAAAEDGSGSKQQQQDNAGGVAGVALPSSKSTTPLHPAVQQQQQQQQRRSAGLDLLSRVWQQNSATPLLPAPPEGDAAEPQRASGGDWGVTDAALSLRALLGSSRWAVGLQQAPQQQQQQQQQDMPAAPADASQQQQTSQQTKQKPPPQLTAQQQQLLSVLSTVVAFDAVSLKGNRGLTWSAQQGLRVLEEAASRLYMELAVGSFSCGLQVEVQGRLKSLRSVHSKMQRKDCSVEEVYDARALRVVVDDGGGSRLADAVQCCYRLISAVHKLWHPIHSEFDDYIANPKPSGYQALHTAVWGPGGAALEVQIKTSGMHEHAEYGGAAHWAYKEVLWGSAPAAAAAVSALDSAAGTTAADAPATAAATAAAAKQGVLQALPPVMFTFDEDGQLLSSSGLAATAAAAATSGSSSSSSVALSGRELVSAVAARGSTREAARVLAAAAVAAASAGSGAGVGRSTAGRAAASVATAERAVEAAVAAAGQQRDAAVPLLARIAAVSKQQQSQAPLRAAVPAAVQTLETPLRAGRGIGSGSSSSSSSHSHSSSSSSSSSSSTSTKQQQHQQVKPAPYVYVGQPVLRVSDRLRYGAVLAVINDSSSSSSRSSNGGSSLLPAAGFGGLVSPAELEAAAAAVTGPAAAHDSSGGSSSSSRSSNAWSNPAASPQGSGRLSLLCVIMSGGTNPDHPWRMPDYAFYQELLQYAGSACWVRPGQGDWHARLEEYEWCRDGRWHRRDHMGYLHPHTTLTLLEGYERDATVAAAAEVSVAAAGPASSASRPAGASGTGDASADNASAVAGPDSSSSSSSSSVCQVTGWRKARASPDPTMLLHSWATGGSWLKSQAAKSSGSSGGSAASAAAQQQQQGGGLTSSAGVAAAAGPGGVQAAGSNWAATAAKAAQLRSVIEWGVEAYGVEEGSQQDGDVSVVIWPGGVIEDVPRGTTAGEILREKGVLAILQDDESSTDSDAEPSGPAACSCSAAAPACLHWPRAQRS
ncbi:hypothetical protein COO60DRAFT_940116 [Scenedesmus sp. NREL 46B-D3]|nr:hypothetical protein COO60DRAFT_940116 [Scenedesmus sp. NREL 46B-D3]